MNPVSAIIVDIEIVRGPLNKNETPVPGIQYVRGWSDHASMSVSVIGVYDYLTDQTRVFGEDNIDAFKALCGEREWVAGFNNIPFDNAVIRACCDGFDLDAKSWDLLRAVWVASGLAPEFSYPSHTGFGLEACSQANGGPPKSGNGALAPVLWQQGKYLSVVDYCCQDVWITRRLIDQARRGVPIACPKTGQWLQVKVPF